MGRLSLWEVSGLKPGSPLPSPLGALIGTAAPLPWGQCSHLVSFQWPLGHGSAGSRCAPMPAQPPARQQVTDTPLAVAETGPTLTLPTPVTVSFLF